MISAYCKDVVLNGEVCGNDNAALNVGTAKHGRSLEGVEAAAARRMLPQIRC